MQNRNIFHALLLALPVRIIEQQEIAMNRRQFVNEQLNIKGSGLEIGPSYNPFFPKKEGYNVKTLDHASGEVLRQKYSSDPAVDVSKIEDVDFVWSGEPYAELIGEEKFDWIFAAHLIEHVPDMIAFINDSSTILKEGGMLALVIPDKRYTFDMYRPQSSLGAVIDAHSYNRKAPSLGNRVECIYTYGVKKEGTSVTDEVFSSFLPQGDIKHAMERAGANSEYVDVHVWAFTPNHFRLIIETLFQAGLISLREKYFHATVGNEFYIILSADSYGPNVNIDKLFHLSLKEAQHRWWSAGRGTHWIRSIVAIFDRRLLGGLLRNAYRRYKRDF